MGQNEPSTTCVKRPSWWCHNSPEVTKAVCFSLLVHWDWETAPPCHRVLHCKSADSPPNLGKKSCRVESTICCSQDGSNYVHKSVVDCSFPHIHSDFASRCEQEHNCEFLHSHKKHCQQRFLTKKNGLHLVSFQNNTQSTLFIVSTLITKCNHKIKIIILGSQGWHNNSCSGRQIAIRYGLLSRSMSWQYL